MRHSHTLAKTWRAPATGRLISVRTVSHSILGVMTTMPRARSVAVLALFGTLGLSSTPAHAQDDLGSAWTASRAELERRVLQLEALTGSTAYSERTRARSAQEAATIRRRLGEGDFRVGDRIYIEIEGAIPEGVQVAPTLSDLQDTVTVFEGARINVRNIGEISLVGVLRSELQARVNTAVNEVILNSRAMTRPLVRVAVFGSVARPGYYNIPLETRLDNLIMLAGGPTVDAATEKMRVVRGDTVVLDESEVRMLISTGEVIGAMGLQEGDQLIVERGAQRLDRQQTLQFAFLFLSPLISTLLIRTLQ